MPYNGKTIDDTGCQATYRRYALSELDQISELASTPIDENSQDFWKPRVYPRETGKRELDHIIVCNKSGQRRPIVYKQRLISISYNKSKTEFYRKQNTMTLEMWHSIGVTSATFLASLC